MFSRLFALIKKEALSIKNDKKSLFVIIMPPLFQIFVFTFAATLEIKNLDLIVLDKDSSAQSKALIETFKASTYVEQVAFAKNYKDGKVAINNQKAIAFIVIPEQFAKNLGSKKSQVQIILDGRRSHSAQMGEGYLNQMILQFESKNQKSSPIELVNRNFYNPNLNNFWWIIPRLFGTISMIVAMILTALSIARERELGTFDQILVSPLRPFEILLGKLLPALIISVFESSLILLIGIFVFQVPVIGSLWLLYLGLVTFLFSMAGIGLFISAISQTQQQAVLGAFVAILPSVLLSGFATPIENMPNWLQPVTAFIPLKYFLIIINGVFLKDISFTNIQNELLSMFALGVVFMTVAMFYFKSKTK